MKKKVVSVKKLEQATRSQAYNCLFDLGIERFCSRSGIPSQFSCQLHFVRNLERGLAHSKKHSAQLRRVGLAPTFLAYLAAGATVSVIAATNQKPAPPARKAPVSAPPNIFTYSSLYNLKPD